MDQAVLNWSFGLLNILFGIIVKALWDSYKELKRTDKELADKVSSIEVLVAGQYVKREDFQNVTSEIFRKLDKILDKLDQKVDKP
jgi:glycyl-tRNA synthetase (class II)